MSTAYPVLLWVLLIGGAVPTAAYLWLHRPTSWRTLRAVDASGMVLVIGLLYLLVGVRMVTGRPPGWDGWPDLLGLAITAAADSLLWLRLLNFWRVTRQARTPARGRGHDQGGST